MSGKLFARITHPEGASMRLSEMLMVYLVSHAGSEFSFGSFLGTLADDDLNVLLQLGERFKDEGHIEPDCLMLAMQGDLAETGVPVNPDALDQVDSRYGMVIYCAVHEFLRRKQAITLNAPLRLNPRPTDTMTLDKDVFEAARAGVQNFFH